MHSSYQQQQEQVPSMNTSGSASDGFTLDLTPVVDVLKKTINDKLSPLIVEYQTKSKSYQVIHETLLRLPEHMLLVNENQQLKALLVKMQNEIVELKVQLKEARELNNRKVVSLNIQEKEPVAKKTKDEMNHKSDDDVEKLASIYKTIQLDDNEEHNKHVHQNNNEILKKNNKEVVEESEEEEKNDDEADDVDSVSNSSSSDEEEKDECAECGELVDEVQTIAPKDEYDEDGGLYNPTQHQYCSDCVPIAMKRVEEEEGEEE